MEKKIKIAGCGPGSVDFVLPATVKAVQDAKTIVGAERLLKLFVDSAADRIVVTAEIDSVLDKVEAALQSGSVTVLVTGGPGLFSLAKSVIKRFGRENCRVIPAVSSVQAAFASIGVDWHDAKIISAHYKLPAVEMLDVNTAKIAILAGHEKIKGWLGELVRRVEYEPEIFICENLTLSDESVRRVIVGELKNIQFGPRSIILIIDKEIL